MNNELRLLALSISINYSISITEAVILINQVAEVLAKDVSDLPTPKEISNIPLK